jgi:hypothetical protein
MLNNVKFIESSEKSSPEQSLAQKACLTCLFPFMLHKHHLMRQAEHPELAKKIGSTVILCKFCHQRVHAKSKRSMTKIYLKQEQVFAELWFIVPSIMPAEIRINFGLIDVLREIMHEKLEQMWQNCIVCGTRIGYKNRAVIRFHCDECRDRFGGEC